MRLFKKRAASNIDTREMELKGNNVYNISRSSLKRDNSEVYMKGLITKQLQKNFVRNRFLKSKDFMNKSVKI